MRRQHINECALFAVCAATGRPYLETSAAYQREYHRGWSHDGPWNWSQFVTQRLQLPITPKTFSVEGLETDPQKTWGRRRLLFSFFPGAQQKHVAFVDENNIVEDGCFEGPVPFARYITELQGVVLGERLL